MCPENTETETVNVSIFGAPVLTYSTFVFPFPSDLKVAFPRSITGLRI